MSNVGSFIVRSVKTPMSRKPLWCAVFAAGGAALAAIPTAVIPFGAAGVVGGLLSGAAANLFHEAFGSAEERAIAAVFRRNPGIDENHHILLALRQAHLNALKYVLSAFDNVWPSDGDDARRAEAARFSVETKRFLKEAGLGKELSAGAATELEREVFSYLPEAFDAALSARGSALPDFLAKEAKDARDEIEAAVLAELQFETATIDIELPALFRSAFVGQPRDGWFDLFVRDGAARLKADPNFSSIWTAERIARIGCQTEAISKTVERTATGLAALIDAQERHHRELMSKQEKLNDRSALKIWGVTIGGIFFGFVSGVIAKPLLTTSVVVIIIGIGVGSYLELISIYETSARLRASSAAVDVTDAAIIPSIFHCNKAMLGVDYVICASPTLMGREARLEDAYRGALATKGNAVKTEQLDWIKRFGPGCGLPIRGQPASDQIQGAASCVRDAIDHRIRELQSEQ